MSTPIQYQNNIPSKENANLSPLQPAISYYMAQGQQVPFFINHEFMQQVTIFADSGIVTPDEVGVPGGTAVIAQGPNNDEIYVIRAAEDCGIDTDRYEKIYIGTRNNVLPGSWSFAGITVRGGSAANGAGGPWGTGGLTSQDPTPNNSVNREPDIVSNLTAAYGATASTATDGIA